MRLSRCVRCELVFAEPQPTDAELARYYGHYWGGDVAVSTPSTRRYYLAQGVSRVRYITRWMRLKGSSVLDVGAGLGLFQDALTRATGVARYVAIETDHTQLAALRARLGENGAFSDVGDVPAGDAFDLIVLSHVLEHMPRPHEFIAPLVARLKPGGLLFVEVPNSDQRYKSNFEPHLLFFDPASLRELLARHGELLDVSTVGKRASALHIVHAQPERGWLRHVKECVKTVIAVATPRFMETQIERYEMSAYGGDRQWLRGLLRATQAPVAA